jgi:hypothetical protein
MGSVKRMWDEHEAANKNGAVNFIEAGLGKKWANMVLRRQSMKSELADLEKNVKELNGKIGEELAATGYKSAICDEWRVTIVDGKNVSISKERLLDLGVAASVIEQATKITVYTTIQITENKL